MFPESANWEPRPSTPNPPPKAFKATPRSARSTGDASTLTEARSDIADEMDTEMLTCSFDAFQKYYLPFIVLEDDILRCAEKLEKAGMLKVLENNLHCWSGFTFPDETAEKEPEVFKFLEAIASELSKYKFSNKSEVEGPLNAPGLKYVDCPNRSVKSEILGADFKIDGCFMLMPKSGLSTGATKKVNAPDAAVIAEFKKKKTQSVKDTVDNRKKIVSAASHIMNDDPRRGFMFGVGFHPYFTARRDIDPFTAQITIEGTMMSLCYFSRSHSTISESFSYKNEPTKLISVFLSFLFGRTQDLGYDPAIHRFGGENIYYEYAIRSQNNTTRYYRTLEALSGYRALGITGRMTRVWEAQEISGFGGEVSDDRKVALKDVWLDCEAQTERAIQEQIFEAIERDDEETVSRLRCLPKRLRRILKKCIKNKNYRQFFMTIDCDQEGGMTTKAKPPSAAPVTGLFSSHDTNSLLSRSHRLAGSGERSRPNPARHPPSRTANDSRGAQTRMYVPKKRYLLVYSEVGKALHYAGKLRTIFQALKHTLFALSLMYIANWVHRDVSTGNIIVVGVGNNACGKLSDLEYAKLNSERPISLDPKTGTPFFMAYEILSGVPLYKPRLKNSPVPTQDLSDDDDDDNDDDGGDHDDDDYDDDDDDDGDDGDANADGDVDNDNNEVQISLPNVPDFPPIEVIHNIQHDLESIWWIILWFLLDRVAHERSRTLGRKIFVNKIDVISSARAKIFLTRSEQQLQVLHKKLHLFIPALEFGRSRLVAAYESQENVFDPASYTSIFKSMLTVLLDCHTLSKSIKNLPLLAPNIGAAPEPSSMDPPPNPTRPMLPLRINAFSPLTPAARMLMGQGDENAPAGMIQAASIPSGA